jgi:hypothetical protein
MCRRIGVFRDHVTMFRVVTILRHVSYTCRRYIERMHQSAPVVGNGVNSQMVWKDTKRNGGIRI